MENENKNAQEEVMTSETTVENETVEETVVDTETNAVAEPTPETVEEAPKTEEAAPQTEEAEPQVEEEEEEMSMEQGMAEMSNMNIRPGQVLEGKVIKVTPDNVFVNINYMSDGVVPKNEYTTDDSIDLTAELKEGDPITVSVVKVRDGEGNVLLSKRRAEADSASLNIERAMAEGTPVTAKVKDAVKGGLRIEVMGLPGFMPASLASDSFIPDLTVMVGKEFDVQIIEFDRHKRRSVVSRKELDRAEKAKKKEEALKNLAKGAVVDGKVMKLMNYGAFIDIGGVEGLAHISDLSYGRIKHPSDVIKEGEDVKVLVKDINQSNGKISLSLKTPENDPWSNIDKYQVGESYEGTVMNIIKSGAFVSLEPGLEGYLHISELSEGQVEQVEDFVTKGQVVQVRIREINHDDRRMSLTMREGNLTREREFGGERPSRRDRFESQNQGERKERAPKQKRERSARGGRGSSRGFADRGYTDKTDNLTLGDLFGDLKSKLNFGDDEE